MKIGFYRADEKLGVQRTEVEVLADLPAEACLWVVHPVGYGGAWDFYQDPMMHSLILECLVRGGAILFISGTPYAGSEARSTQMSSMHNDRIHCLSSSVSTSDSKAAERLRNFIRTMESLGPSEPVPWDKAEPATWPQNLVSLYLILRAIEYSPNDAESIRTAWSNMEPDWRRNVLRSAFDEYQDSGFSLEDWLISGFPEIVIGPIELPFPDKVASAVAELKRVLAHSQ